MAEENKNNRPDERKKIIVRRDSREWIVQNEGDSAVFFSSEDKEAAVKFAKNMAETHKVKMEVVDDEREKDRDEGKKDERDSTRSSNGEKRQNKKNNIIVERDRDDWIVKNENDSAVLFSSAIKEDALKFAKEMGKEHEVEVVEKD